MARQVIKTATGPQDITLGGETVSICMCGLSSTQPFCDQSHKATEDEIEGVVYAYDENDNKIAAFEDVAETNGCCGSGGGCCGGGCHDDEE